MAPTHRLTGSAATEAGNGRTQAGVSRESAAMKADKPDKHRRGTRPLVGFTKVEAIPNIRGLSHPGPGSPNRPITVR